MLLKSIHKINGNGRGFLLYISDHNFKKKTSCLRVKAVTLGSQDKS